MITLFSLNMAYGLKTMRFPIAALFITFACHQPPKEKPVAAITAEAPANLNINNPVKLCFQQVFGQQNQDTAWVQLEISAQQVTGRFRYLPFEKDARRGTLIGTKMKDEITARCLFKQEGQLDSLPVQFKLAGNQLRQKPFRYNKNTGREYLADTTAYSVIFQEIDWADFPKQINK